MSEKALEHQIQILKKHTPGLPGWRVTPATSSALRSTGRVSVYGSLMFRPGS